MLIKMTLCKESVHRLQEGQLLQLLMEILQTSGTVSCKDDMEGGQ